MSKPYHEIVFLAEKDGRYLPEEVTSVLLTELQASIGDVYNKLLTMAALADKGAILLVSLTGELDDDMRSSTYKLVEQPDKQFISIVEPQYSVKAALHNQNAELSFPKNYSLEQFYQQLALLARRDNVSWLVLKVLSETGEDASAQLAA